MTREKSGEVASQVVLTVKNLPANAGDADSIPPLVGKMPWRRKMATHSIILA